jgi:VWFA-related protein
MSSSRLEFLAIPLLFAALTPAQQNPTPTLSQRPEPTPAPAAAAEGRIRLDVVVTDKSGKPVTGLGLNDFTLLDNGHPSRILSFRAVDAQPANATTQKSEPPVEVILLLDTVNQPVDKISIARQQIERFLLQNDGHLAQPVSILLLTEDKLKALGRASTDGKALAAELKRIGPTLGALDLRRNEMDFYIKLDQFQFSIKGLSLIVNQAAAKPGRKLLLWVGTGWPMDLGYNSERYPRTKEQDFENIVEFSTGLREAQMSAYSVSFGMPDSTTAHYGSFLKGIKRAEQADPNDMALGVFAVQSGGRVLGPGDNILAQIDRCVEDAKAYYVLSFDPPRADGPNEYHDLRVQIDNPKLTARTNTGYYNQP